MLETTSTSITRLKQSVLYALGDEVAFLETTSTSITRLKQVDDIVGHPTIEVNALETTSTSITRLKQSSLCRFP